MPDPCFSLPETFDEELISVDDFKIARQAKSEGRYLNYDRDTKIVPLNDHSAKPSWHNPVFGERASTMCDGGGPLVQYIQCHADQQFKLEKVALKGVERLAHVIDLAKRRPPTSMTVSNGTSLLTKQTHYGTIKVDCA